MIWLAQWLTTDLPIWPAFDAVDGLIDWLRWLTLDRTWLARLLWLPQASPAFSCLQST